MIIRRAALLTLTAFAALAFATPGFSQDGFTPLFDGKTLDGWEQKGGEAVYKAEEGMIVGHSAPNTQNSFLCTKKTYGDFILTYEYKCDAELNSGVQIRGECYDKETTVNIKGKDKTFAAGRVHGYQVEIDPNKPDRMWSGGIYDEGRRGWLFPGQAGGDEEKFTKEGKAAYKPGEWNTVRVACRGDRIRTWLNGTPRADFRDDVTARGFIALQVHGVGDREEPVFVRWRNLQIKEITE